MVVSVDKLLGAGCADASRADVTRADGHRVCRSRGGESCAFDGAMIVLQPIADAAHVIHGPLACCTNTWEGRGALSSVGDLHRRGFATALGELDIVYGGEDKLRRAIAEVAERVRPAAVFVHATCVSGLTGEDLGAVCRDAAAEIGLPVIAVNAPGFVGPKNLGNRIAGEVLVEHVIGTAEPAMRTPADIALIGEYNIAGDSWLIEELLAECGIRVLSRVTGDARFEEIRHAHRARLAVLVCGRALVNVAAHLRDRWGVPGVEASFFGPTEIARSLRAISDALEHADPVGNAGLRERVERVIARREAELAERLPRFETLRGKRAVLYSGGVKSWSLVSALRDLGIETVAVGAKKASYEDEAKARELLGPNVPILEDISAPVIRGFFARGETDILVAGGRNQYLAAKEGWPFIDVNQERESAYAGYEGFLNMAEDLRRRVAFYEAQRRAAAPPIPTSRPASPSREAAVRAAVPRGAVPRGAAPAPQPLGSIAAACRAAAIDPPGHAPSLGAVMALQGVHRALPLLHGAQGCAFLEKVLLVKHFREPIALATTKLFTEDVVLGSEDALEAAIRKACGAASGADGGTAAAPRAAASAATPEIVAVIPSAMAEVKGDDVSLAISRAAADVAVDVVVVRAPDYEGGLEAGFAAAVRSLVALAEPGETDERRVCVLAGPHLTPGDAAEVRAAAETFGLEAVLLPDLSALDGGRERLSALAEGGVTLAALRSLGAAVSALALGRSLEPAASDLLESCGVPYEVLDGPCGLAQTDRLMAALSALAGHPTPARLARARRALVDLARDAQSALAGARVAIALEPDHALAVADALAECGAEIVLAVVPQAGRSSAEIAAERVVVGDLATLEDEVRACGGVDLIVASSHGTAAAERLGAAHLLAGIPNLAFGAAARVSVGYAGTARLLADAANLLAARHTHPTRPRRMP